MGNCVTQYIGARYVPLFADPIDWTDDRTYEPLTIVLHQGNSYTSRCTVPKGIDITDEYYWAQTGNYNAQVEQYRTEVGEYKTQVNCYIGKVDEAVEKVEQDMTQLREDVTTEMDQVKSEVQNDIQDVRDELADVDALAKTNESDIADLESELNKINQGRVVNVKALGAVGDGITDDTNALKEALANYDYVIIPKGDYVISEWLYLHSDLTIKGPGKLINKNTSGGLFFWASSDNDENMLYNCIIDGVEIEGYEDYENSGITIVAGKSTKSIDNVCITNCFIHDVGGRGIDLGGESTDNVFRVIGNKIENTGGIGLCNSKISGIFVGNNVSNCGLETMTIDNGCKSVTVSSNIFIGGPQSNGAGIVSVDEIDGLTFTGNIINAFETTKPGFRANGNTGDMINMTISGNYIGGGESSISLGGTHRAYNTTISGNVLGYSANQAIWCTDECRISASGNHCDVFEDEDARYMVTSGILEKDVFLNSSAYKS